MQTTYPKSIDYALVIAFFYISHVLGTFKVSNYGILHNNLNRIRWYFLKSNIFCFNNMSWFLPDSI